MHIQDILRNQALFLHLAKFGGTSAPCTPSFVATERYKIATSLKKMFPVPKTETIAGNGKSLLHSVVGTHRENIRNS